MINPFKKDNSKEIQEIKAQALKESTEVLVKGISTVLTSFGQRIEAAILERMIDIKNELKKEQRNIVDGKNPSVYAFYFIKVDNFIKKEKIVLLVQVMANGTDQAITKSHEYLTSNGYNPSDWRAIETSVIDIIIKDEVKTVVPSKKELSVNDYINSLLYARDRFAEKPYEKGVLTKIINNIKNKYANAA